MSEPVEIVELRPQRAVVMRRTVARDHLGEFFMEVYPKISAAITAAGATQAGPPYSRYYNEDPSAFDVEAGIPFTGANPSGKDMRVIELPGGRAAKTLHIGSYETLHTEYARIGGWADQGGGRLAGGPLGVVRRRRPNHPSRATADRGVLAAGLEIPRDSVAVPYQRTARFATRLGFSSQ